MEVDILKSFRDKYWISLYGHDSAAKPCDVGEKVIDSGICRRNLRSCHLETSQQPLDNLLDGIYKSLKGSRLPGTQHTPGLSGVIAESFNCEDLGRPASVSTDHNHGSCGLCEPYARQPLLARWRKQPRHRSSVRTSSSDEAGGIHACLCSIRYVSGLPPPSFEQWLCMRQYDL